MSLSLRSSEENSGCRKYGEHTHTGGVIYLFLCSVSFGWALFVSATIYAHAFLHFYVVRFYAQQHPEHGRGQTERASGQALVEVVVCAVGRVVILPLVEMTAQSTALLALVTDDGGIGLGWAVNSIWTGLHNSCVLLNCAQIWGDLDKYVETGVLFLFLNKGCFKALWVRVSSFKLFALIFQLFFSSEPEGIRRKVRCVSTSQRKIISLNSLIKHLDL